MARSAWMKDDERLREPARRGKPRREAARPLMLTRSRQGSRDGGASSLWPSATDRVRQLHANLQKGARPMRARAAGGAAVAPLCPRVHAGSLWGCRWRLPVATETPKRVLWIHLHLLRIGSD